MSEALLPAIRETFRIPFTPHAIERLDDAGGYLEIVWPRVAASVETAGFLGSALYMADMALDAVEAVYEPLLSRDTLRDAGLSAADLANLEAVLDLFHYTQPQLLLLLAALAEAWDRAQVGGHGRPDRRERTERERRHQALEVRFAPSSMPPLPEVVAALGVEAPPDLYRAVAMWPRYVEAAWEELQHLGAYPDFRRRGRALYFYARSGARFLAEPLRANPEALREAGMDGAAIAAARAALDTALPSLATMMMHVEAMRLGLGLRAREVVAR